VSEKVAMLMERRLSSMSSSNANSSARARTEEAESLYGHLGNRETSRTAAPETERASRAHAAEDALELVQCNPR
jgi:hypothetical protein